MKILMLFVAVSLLLAGCNNAPAPQNTTTAPTESTGTYQEPEIDVDTFTEETVHGQDVDISDLLPEETTAPTKPDTEKPSAPAVPETTAPDVPETTAPITQTTPEESTSAPAAPQPDSDGYQSVIVRP